MPQSNTETQLAVITIQHCTFGVLKSTMLGLAAVWLSCASALECALPLQVPAIVLEQRVVLFGEIHGTNESPLLVGEYVCFNLKVGKKVKLALELPVSLNPELQDYLRGDGSSAAKQKILADPFWSRSFQDGRSSLAMFRLIERARVMMQDTNQLTVHPIASGDSAQMAATLATVIEEDPQSSVISLTGNAHAAIVKGRYQNPDFEPMGYRLEKYRPYNVSIEFGKGSAWVCTASCGVKDMSGRLSMEGTELGFLTKGGAIPGYKATYLIREVTPSFPATSTQ